MLTTKKDYGALFTNLLKEKLGGIECDSIESPPNDAHGIIFNRFICGSIPSPGIMHPFIIRGTPKPSSFIRIAGFAISVDANSEGDELWEIITKEMDMRAILCASEISKMTQKTNSIHIHCSTTESMDVVDNRKHIGIDLKWW